MPVAPSRTAAAGTLAAVLALVLAAPTPGAALQVLAGAGPQVPETQALVALVALLAWALAGWSCAVVAVTTGGHLPGHAGRALATVARRTAPASVRHTVELALGLTVAAGVLTSPASAGTGAAAPMSASPTTTPPAPTLDWGAEPTDPAAAVAPETAAPDTVAPGTVAPGTVAPDLDPAAACSDVRRTTPTSAAPLAATTVLVRPGDTLWDLAEEDLRAGARSEPTDAQVAASWPSWWAANREVVGDDPHLLLPGMVLQLPAATAHPPAA